MDAVTQRRTQLIAQIKSFLVWLWHILRNPKITVALLILLTLVLMVGLLLPQQQVTIAGNATARTVWLNDLPVWIQPFGGVLYTLGFAQIFYTPWFWIPAALLLLNSLIALADYTPGCWRRMLRGAPPVDWQHPLACRVEYSVRLSHFPDDFTELFQIRFNQQGFISYNPSLEPQRTKVAFQRRWGWLGIPLFYTGLLTLLIAFVLTFFFLEVEYFTLSPIQSRYVNLLEGQLDLMAVDPNNGIDQLKLTPDDEGISQLLTWRHYRPSMVNNTIVIPTSGSPIITIEVSDDGELIELDPLPENLPPIKRLNLALTDGVDDSIYFTIPSMDTAVQISPGASTDVFDVQVRRGDAAELIDNISVKPGEEFEINGMTALLTLEHSINVIVRNDAGLPFYILAVILILGGIILTLLRPAVIWLVPEVKGIGGQLYGVIETFGSEKKMLRSLEQLMIIDNVSTTENGE
jgi:cytochrome c biogenesis protein ResB